MESEISGYEAPGGDWLPYPPPPSYPRRPTPDDAWTPRDRRVPRDVRVGVGLLLVLLGPVGLFFTVRGLRAVQGNPAFYRGLPLAYVALFLSLWATFALVFLLVFRFA